MPDRQTETPVWDCPDWSATFQALVGALRRGEDIAEPTDPMLFTVVPPAANPAGASDDAEVTGTVHPAA